jgi:hypothetical protein
LSHLPSPHFTHDPPDPGGIWASQPKASKFLWSQELVVMSPSQQALQSTQDPPATSPSLAQPMVDFVLTAGAAFASHKEQDKKRRRVALNLKFFIESQIFPEIIPGNRIAHLFV